MIAQLRKQAGYTQETLSEALGFGRPYISRVESGDRRPSWKFITAFANLLHISPITLLRQAGYMQEATNEEEIAALVAANPDFAGILEFAREHPDKLPEVLRYARWIAAGAPEIAEEVKETRAAPESRRGVVAADT